MVYPFLYPCVFKRAIMANHVRDWQQSIVRMRAGVHVCVSSFAIAVPSNSPTFCIRSIIWRCSNWCEYVCSYDLEWWRLVAWAQRHEVAIAALEGVAVFATYWF